MERSGMHWHFRVGLFEARYQTSALSINPSLDVGYSLLLEAIQKRKQIRAFSGEHCEWVGDWLHPQGGRVSLGYVLVLVRYHHCSCQTHACHQSELMTHSNREYGPAIM